MPVNNLKRNSGYGLEQALYNVAPQPIVSRRNPTNRDMAPLGQLWVNRTANTVYYLSNIANNLAVWSQAASAVGDLTVGGTLTAGTGLVATAGGVTATAGGLTVSAGGATIVGLTAVTGAITATTSILAGTSITATAGAITTTVGSINSGNNILAQNHITSTAGNITAIAGNITSTLGNLVATNGDVVISTATKGITLPGPVRIITGAGAPAAGLAVNVGDMYINTTAASAVTRLYIATAASTWTNVTCAA